ncbi:hypothetical protein BUALT_Bualt03G0003000 [Buddleja alternifolia]|uniref:Uncharacterized protein n=1 Tax=Buddleja alternifolia TaxID=168488 RepID=A0AAV6XY98_9LAMI|nr:hypothetical protein BUALT_Bualt03G0003000 [Buddleja alternifolia]
MSHHQIALGRPPSSGKRRLKDLLAQRDNRACADCGALDPKWASANIGVFICLKCCGVHRSLGTHISKVLSVTLDEWSEEEVDSMFEVGGNASANSIYEAYIPEGVSKPGPDAGHEQRSKFIRSKYERQEFLKPSLRILSSSSKKHSLQASLSQKLMNSFRSSSSSNKKSKVQTSVVKSNLNPVWNEELMLSVPQNYGPIKLQVYDYDTFSADDIMGEAEIDIQPMITSATAFGDAGMFGNMQIGKWLKSHDNALLEDSTVNIVDGKVKQAVKLKLQNVESGELDLEIEWIPLDQ